MKKNYILNLLIDEDSAVSVYEESLSDFDFVEFLFEDEYKVDVDLMDKEEMKKKVDEFVEEEKEKYNDEEYLRDLEKCGKEMKEKIDELMDEEGGVEGDKMCVRMLMWGVEYDSCLSLIIKVF